MNSRKAAIQSAQKESRSRSTNFLTALKKENLRLQRRLAKLQATKVSLGHRIRALETELAKERNLPKVRDLMAEIEKRGRSPIPSRPLKNAM